MSRPASPIQFPTICFRQLDVEEIRYQAPLSLDGGTSPTDSSNECAVCLDSLSSKASVVIRSCGHAFHQECITACLRQDPKCPNCRQSVGEPQGVSPSGTMTISKNPAKCPGYDCSCIEIKYVIPRGKQMPYHENPGQPYHPTDRVAYLPNNASGRQLAARLKYAWMHGLMFRVGTSLTTGRPNSVVWSSIHHKTSLHGGTHGFPDPNYLGNCNNSLDALNVPTAGSCELYDNALDVVVHERLDYKAPSTLMSRLSLQNALDRYEAGATTISKGEPQGRSPSGTMKITRTKRNCPGFACNTFQIDYHFDGGIQTDYHPNPGVPYPGTTRVAFLPDNEEGLELLIRLKYAFKHGLCFAIGTSLTTGEPNRIVWGTIPHKTSLIATAPYSFPDHNYVVECHTKLNALGVPSADLCS